MSDAAAPGNGAAVPAMIVQKDPPAAALAPIEIKTVGLVEIPTNIFVRCPATDGVAWKNIAARRCEPCPYFKGLGIIATSDKPLKFEQQYSVKCGFPIDRKVMAIEFG